MNVKIDIHKNNQVEKKLNKVPYWKVPPTTKKEIILFIEQGKIGQVQHGKRLSDRTLSKYLSLLKRSLEIINKPTNQINKKDVEGFDKKLTAEGLASVVDYRRSLKVFLGWKLGEDKSKKIAGWMDTRDKNKTPDYLSEKEIDKLFKNCKNPAEKFLISVIFDSGARIEEFLNIRYEDIQLPDKNNNYVKIMFKEEYSKTIGRNISLYWKHTLESVRDFLKQREQEGIKSSDPVYNVQSYDAIRHFLKRLGKKVLNKSIHCHLFRHSSATYYATRLNRQELCYRYGWKFSSDMPDVYISRAGMESKQLDEKFKSTELEDIEKKISIIKFENQKELERQKEEFGKKIEAVKKDNQKIIKTLAGIGAGMTGFVKLLKGDPETFELFIKKNQEKVEESFVSYESFIK